MMKELKTTAHLVKAILEQDEKARSSDNYLYLKVVQHCGACRGVPVDNMPLSDFLLNMSDMGIPGFETVRRTRQKIQREFPELASAEAVQGFREAREEAFRDFARGLA